SSSLSFSFLLLLRPPSLILFPYTTLFRSCGHELGHHFCRHTGNTECLNRKNLRFSTMGNEAEANEFMVDLMLDGVNPRDYDTKGHLLQSCGIPAWAEKYVDWETLTNSVIY